MSDSDLQSRLSAIEDIRDKVSEICKSATIAQYNWRPSPEKWSIAECIEHLIVTGNLYNEELKNTLEKAREEGKTGDASIDYGWFSKFAVSTAEPPPKQRIRAFRKILPESKTYDPDKLKSDFDQMLDTYKDLVKNMEGIQISKVKMPSVLTPILRLPVAAWVDFLNAHLRRHLWQAEQVRNKEQFPEAGSGQ
ncbi:MAG: hypothetical protein CL946_05680 [Ectothiorhodospiraceae bacterium]|nr:hypothetical protein [Ectothiorhodospiraceae bacterium]